MSSALQTFTARSQGKPQTEPMMSDTLSVREYETLLPLRQSSELGMRGTARLSAVLWDPVCPQQRCLGAHTPCLLLASDVSGIFTLSLFSPNAFERMYVVLLCRLRFPLDVRKLYTAAHSFHLFAK
jgi:hypothetical protein